MSLETIAYVGVRSFTIVNTGTGTPDGLVTLQQALGFELADYFRPTAPTTTHQAIRSRNRGDAVCLPERRCRAAPFRSLHAST